MECKLWRNPQARREVLAQILEYASLLRGWSYGDLTARLKAARGGLSAGLCHRFCSPDLDLTSYWDLIHSTDRRPPRVMQRRLKLSRNCPVQSSARPRLVYSNSAGG